MSILLFATLLALTRPALCLIGDICYMVGATATIVQDRVYFMGGTYSVVEVNDPYISPSSSLFSIDLDSTFPIDRYISQSVLTKRSIPSQSSPAYYSAKNGTASNSVDSKGAYWSIGDLIYVFGGGYKTPNNKVSVYNVTANKWTEASVGGGDFNFGARTSAQFASAPGSSLGFISGGSAPFMSGMIRFDATDPDHLSWTNETLNNGSFGAEVPNFNAGTMIYIPAGKEGMLISFGGGNVTEGTKASNTADWSLVYIYDIASHTWWVQKASGVYPDARKAFCSVVTVSPDDGAIHITTYGGWSYPHSRSYEDLYVLSIPSFKWINATSVSIDSNHEQQVLPSIGRDSMNGACQVYQGSQMVVVGGQIRQGGTSWTGGNCTDTLGPLRALDLTTYQWLNQSLLNITYQVPSLIYKEIGGNASGGATVIAPSGGFADPTLASLIQLRVPTSTSSVALNSSSPQQQDGTSHSKTGAIAGGVVGGVAFVALVAGAAWFLVRKRRGRSKMESENKLLSGHIEPSKMEPMELEAKDVKELPATGQITEMDAKSQQILEIGGNNNVEPAELEGDSIDPRHQA